MYSRIKGYLGFIRWFHLLPIVLILVAGIVAIPFFPTQLLTVDSGNVQGDLIVVLGGSPEEGRPERAAELFHLGCAPRVLVSGYGDADEYSAVLVQNGVPSSKIVVERDSKSTLQNATFAVPLIRQLGAQRVIIVTSWYHSRRALACFEHVAPDLQLYSRPSYIGYPQTEPARYRETFHIRWEFAKILGYWMYYGVWPFPLK